MIVRRISNCKEFVAGDGCRIREVIGQEWDSVKPGYSVAYAKVESGKETKRHRMKTSSELYFIVEGEGEMHVNDEVGKVAKGDAVFIPANSWQWIRNSGKNDLAFVCIVNPAWKKEDEEVPE